MEGFSKKSDEDERRFVRGDFKVINPVSMLHLVGLEYAEKRSLLDDVVTIKYDGVTSEVYYEVSGEAYDDYDKQLEVIDHTEHVLKKRFRVSPAGSYTIYDPEVVAVLVTAGLYLLDHATIGIEEGESWAIEETACSFLHEGLDQCSGMHGCAPFSHRRKRYLRVLARCGFDCSTYPVISSSASPFEVHGLRVDYTGKRIKSALVGLGDFVLWKALPSYVAEHSWPEGSPYSLGSMTHDSSFVSAREYCKTRRWLRIADDDRVISVVVEDPPEEVGIQSRSHQDSEMLFDCSMPRSELGSGAVAAALQFLSKALSGQEGRE